MSEIILSAVIIGLLVEVAYLTASHKAEVEKLTKALIAKNLTELDRSTIIEKEQPTKMEAEPEFIPIEQADDKLFSEAIKN